MISAEFTDLSLGPDIKIKTSRSLCRFHYWPVLSDLSAYHLVAVKLLKPFFLLPLSDFISARGHLPPVSSEASCSVGPPSELISSPLHVTFIQTGGSAVPHFTLHQEISSEGLATGHDRSYPAKCRHNAAGVSLPKVSSNVLNSLLCTLQIH